MGQLITGAGFSGTIGGNITVYGTAERQTIAVADVAGIVTLDPSFNKGGDTIVLGKSASAYTIAQSGSTVVLTSGDRKIIVPVGTTANTIQFADGDRTLIYDNGFKLGDQTVTTTAAAIAAAGSAKGALAADASTFAARLVLSGESASVGGNVSVFGTAGVENVSVLSGKVAFDPSFNKGGDTIGLSSAATNYSAVRKGSSAIISGGGVEATIPVGTTGTTIDFSGDGRKLVYDSGYFTVGKQLVIDTVRQIYGGNRQEISTQLSVWQNGVDKFQVPGKAVINNIWGLDKNPDYVIGRDYTSRIFYDTVAVNKNAELFWSFPDKLLDPQGAKVYGFPEVTWGNPLPLYGWDNSVPVAQIKDIVSFKETFSVTYLGDTSKFSLLHDMWIFNGVGRVVGELTIWSSPDQWTKYWAGAKGFFATRPDAKNFIFQDGAVSYNLIVVNWDTPQGYPGTNYMLTPINDQQPGNNLTIDYKKLLDFLVERDLIDKNLYIHSIELGAEIHMGTGGFIVDEFSVTLTKIDPATGSYITIG